MPRRFNLRFGCAFAASVGFRSSHSVFFHVVPYEHTGNAALQIKFSRIARRYWTG
jgi:hypothetical protein